MKRIAKKTLWIIVCMMLPGSLVLMSACSGESEPVQNPQVTIEMESGAKIVIELYPDKAPNTVNNFIDLVKSGFYDGLTFHRVIPSFVVQGGDPAGNGSGGPGYKIKGEFAANGFEQNDLKHTRGVVSMAREGNPQDPDPIPYYDTAGSQFFICMADLSSLDVNGYAAFGMVIDGMDEVERIANVEVSTDPNEKDRPVTPEVMKKVTVDTFGAKYKKPETIK